MEMEEEPPLQMTTTRPSSPWLILDRFIVHRSSHRRRTDGASTSSAASHDCIGRPIRAYLDVADPPAVSRLHLRWPPGTPSIRGMEPAAIAAHGDCILFMAYAPFMDPHCHHYSSYFVPIDYFVYSASSPSPSLTRLPPCFIGVDARRDDRHFRPYRRQRQRVMMDRAMGLLRHGEDGEFTVADLTERERDDHVVELCTLHHAPRGSRAGLDHQWSVRPLRVPPGMETAGLDLFSFDSDAVVPVGGGFLAWVDYYQGMLLVDVLHLHENAAELRFVPMPAEALLSDRWHYDEGIPDPARCVGVTDAGIVKLVCIITPDRRRSPDAFTIATWTLADIDGGGVWDKDEDTAMDDGQFFGLCCGVTSNANKISRQQPPSFPMVSLVDPDVVCFLLEEEHGGVVWMVEVNMRTKVLLSRAVYLEEEEARRNPFDDLRNFISYLSTTR